MNPTPYTTVTTITNTKIIVDSFVGGERLIDVIDRGPDEDLSLGVIAKAHKARASTVLVTDSSALQAARRAGYNVINPNAKT